MSTQPLNNIGNINVTVNFGSYQNVNLNEVEQLFGGMESEDIVELALQAKVIDGVNDNVIDASDIKILESFGLKITEDNGIQDVNSETANASDTENSQTSMEQALSSIDSLNAEIARLDAEIEASKAELAAKQEELEDAKAGLASEQKVLEELNDKYKENAKEYDSIQEAIEAATSSLEAEVKQEQQKAIYQAMSEYDPNDPNCGSWNSFLENRLSKLDGGSKMQGLIESLSGRSASVASDMGRLQLQITGQQGIVDAASRKVTTLNSEIANISQTISANEAQKTQLSSQIITAIMNSLSPEEKALIDDNNIDLTEKLPDGSPRYIFAKGKEDGLYHVYEMGECGQSGTSLARTYGENGGFDIIASGNGYLNNLEKVGDCQGEKIYYMDSCSTVGSFNGCYTTCSPLSFDLNGDGVKTSSEIIEYDIDGDGILDRINDSADGILVFDKDGDGIAGADGSECFGDNTDIDGDGQKDGYKDGFEALKAFAMNAGVINGADDMVIDADDIKFLEENFGFGMKTEGYNSETKSLLDLGITEINLANTDETETEDNFDNMGNQLMTQKGATFVQNGETKDYADIWHEKK